MDYAEFEKRKRIEAAPLFVVVGDEPFLKQRAMDRIVQALSRGPEGIFGVRMADAEGPEEQRPSSLQEALADVSTPSLFSAGAVVVVKRADKLLGRAGAPEALLEYLERPARSGTLVLDLKSLDGRTRLGRALRDSSAVVECKRLYDQPPPWKRDAAPHDNPLAQWIVQEGRGENLSFGLPVAQELAERVGNHLGALHEEIGKLALYLGAGSGRPAKVSSADVAASVGDYNEFGVFRFADAVGDRDLAEALRISRGLFEQGVRTFGSGERAQPARAPGILLERVHGKLREIFRARAVLDAGGSAEDVGRALEKHRAFLPGLLAQAGRWPLERMHEALDALFQAEIRMKTGSDGRTEVERVLVQLLA